MPATITIRPTGYREILDDLHELVNRLAFAMVVAALVIGFRPCSARPLCPTGRGKK